MDISLETQRSKWLKLHYSAVLLLMLYAVSGPLEPYGGSLAFEKLHIVFCSVVFAFYFFFRRLDTTVEAKLLLLFGIWLYITRALNLDIFLIEDFNLVFDMFFCYVILDTGILLDRKHRERLFDWISIACGVVFSILGIFSISAALLQKIICIPITGLPVGMCNVGLRQLYIANNNPNVCGIWFTMTAMLMACQFIKCKRWPWRIPIVLAILINYFALTLTFSRNSMLAFCFGCALLGMQAVMSCLKRPKKWLRISAALVLAVILLVGVYKSFDYSAKLISKVSYTLTSSDAPVSDLNTVLAPSDSPALAIADTAEAASTQLPEAPTYEDTRNLSKSISNLSDRLPIFLSAFYSFEQQPKRLIIGCVDKDVMTISNSILPRGYAHLHNSYLQAFALTGLPGFLLIMAFFVLLVVRMVRLFFSEKAEVGIWVKSLAAPMTGLLTYNLLETSMFHYTDFRGEMVFFLAGILLGFYYDMYPIQKKQKSEPSAD